MVNGTPRSSAHSRDDRHGAPDSRSRAVRPPQRDRWATLSLDEQHGDAPDMRLRVGNERR